MTGKAVLTRGSFCARTDDAPSLPGAYILAIELAQPLTVALPGKPATSLRPGRYLYCGSARGPGGLKARLGRHMRRGKSVRWHVDLLTEAGGVLGAWAFPGGDECALAAALSRLPDADRRLRQQRLRPVPRPPVWMAGSADAVD